MLVLASNSASRKAMLEAAGVPFTVQPASIDERAIEAGLAGADPATIALRLAAAKAAGVDGADALVLGSDSLVTVAGQRFDKPATREDAARHLRFFSGKVIELHSAAAIQRGGAPLWQEGDCALLHVRDLSDAFIEKYLEAEWPAVSGCVGVFRIEGRGVQLFERIDGDHFTILGMPLLKVLAALRREGAMR